MNDTTAPASGLGLGDKIAHDLLPGFVMEVQGVAACKTDSARPAPHHRYKITDPEGREDWLCAYDVHPVSVSP